MYLAIKKKIQPFYNFVINLKGSQFRLASLEIETFDEDFVKVFTRIPVAIPQRKSLQELQTGTLSTIHPSVSRDEYISIIIKKEGRSLKEISLYVESSYFIIQNQKREYELKPFEEAILFKNPKDFNPKAPLSEGDESYMDQKEIYIHNEADENEDVIESQKSGDEEEEEYEEEVEEETDENVSVDNYEGKIN